ncbi:hypothetical protein niasHS_007160 [Heterodera schachtii]|uniref:Uncharacterized protein n=1 Tax=Heterodera schachtii TaxID=97005 RepID=A0ABD2JL62_HETSC
MIGEIKEGRGKAMPEAMRNGWTGGDRGGSKTGGIGGRSRLQPTTDDRRDEWRVPSAVSEAVSVRFFVPPPALPLSSILLAKLFNSRSAHSSAGGGEQRDTKRRERNGESTTFGTGKGRVAEKVWHHSRGGGI